MDFTCIPIQAALKWYGCGVISTTKTEHHLGPYNDKGHLGDLPAIYINADGSVTTPVLAPRLKVSDIIGHSLMIHNGGDNYSDTLNLAVAGTNDLRCNYKEGAESAK